MGFDKWVLLSRLRKAVKKVRFILNFNISHRLRLASILGSKSVQRLSFNDRPGLRGVADGTDIISEESYGSTLQRTSSYVSDFEDIDNRAEMFINNFYRQLQIERQVSLELQYLRGNSLERTRSD